MDSWAWETLCHNWLFSISLFVISLKSKSDPFGIDNVTMLRNFWPIWMRKGASTWWANSHLTFLSVCVQFFKRWTSSLSAFDFRLLFLFGPFYCLGIFRKNANGSRIIGSNYNISDHKHSPPRYHRKPGWLLYLVFNLTSKLFNYELLVAEVKSYEIIANADKINPFSKTKSSMVEPE